MAAPLSRILPLEVACRRSCASLLPKSWLIICRTMRSLRPKRFPFPLLGLALLPFALWPRSPTLSSVSLRTPLRMARGKKKAKSAQVVWLYLLDNHYQVLLPKPELTESTAQEWLRTAIFQPTVERRLPRPRGFGPSGFV